MFATSSSTANIIPFPPRGSFSPPDLLLGPETKVRNFPHLTSTGIVGLASRCFTGHAATAVP